MWALWCLLCPTWSGVIYHRFDAPAWQKSGAFGITGTGLSPFHRRSPLWNPPSSSGPLDSVVRWPLQSVTQPYSLEINFAATVTRMWMGLIVAGLVASAVRRVLRPHPQNTVLTCAWWMSCFGLIVLLGVGFLSGVTMGMLPGSVMTVLLAVASTIAGLRWGIRSEQKREASASGPTLHRTERASQ